MMFLLRWVVVAMASFGGLAGSASARDLSAELLSAAVEAEAITIWYASITTSRHPLPRDTLEARAHLKMDINCGKNCRLYFDELASALEGAQAVKCPDFSFNVKMSLLKSGHEVQRLYFDRSMPNTMLFGDDCFLLKESVAEILRPQGFVAPK